MIKRYPKSAGFPVKSTIWHWKTQFTIVPAWSLPILDPCPVPAYAYACRQEDMGRAGSGLSKQGPDKPCVLVCKNDTGGEAQARGLTITLSRPVAVKQLTGPSLPKTDGTV